MVLSWKKNESSEYLNVCISFTEYKNKGAAHQLFSGSTENNANKFLIFSLGGNLKSCSNHNSKIC